MRTISPSRCLDVNIQAPLFLKIDRRVSAPPGCSNMRTKVKPRKKTEWRREGMGRFVYLCPWIKQSNNEYNRINLSTYTAFFGTFS